MSTVSRNFGRDGRPLVIRRVVRKDRHGRAKVARDSKAGISIERIKARVPRPCGYYKCPHLDRLRYGRQEGIISEGTEFARLDSGERRRMGGRLVPIFREYHFDCLPPEARPLLRFFFPYRWKMRLVTGPEHHETREFTSVETWELWLSRNYPGMMRSGVFRVDTEERKQRGTGYFWSSLERTFR